MPWLGLMVLPFVLGAGQMPTSGHAGAHSGAGVHAAHLAGLAVSGSGAQTTALFATVLHTASYCVVAGTIAWVVFERLGVRFLRHAWINMDVIWAAALIVTAVATPTL